MSTEWLIYLLEDRGFEVEIHNGLLKVGKSTGELYAVVDTKSLFAVNTNFPDFKDLTNVNQKDFILDILTNYASTPLGLR